MRRANTLISQLASDDIPGQVFVVAGKKLRGSLSVKKLLQETDINQSIRHLMDSCLFRVKPDDERQQVIAELSERGLDLVPVVDKGELVGCLMEKEIAHLLEDDVTEDAQLQGATLPLEKPYLEISPWTLWKKRSVWLLLLFVAEAYTSSVLQHFEEAPGIGHRAGLLYSAAHRHRRQQRNADHLDAGALDGAGGKCDCAIWGG
ncbi:magnesium transporter [Klebsiella pneumoniae]|uniref:Magnesium transporter n=1 Tax=Klebsiella pneumoniae TaxID=573 RepID=A0A2X3G7I2_KLEPN|nr:magnesium transporter [Klebsiella pneumoniae]